MTSPPHLSAAQSKERAPARDYATASALPADPVRPAEHRRPKVEERSGRAFGADVPRFCPLGQNFAEGPQLRLALAMLDALASALQAEWGHGVGRHARQMRGEIVSTCKDLRVRSRSLRGTDGIVPLIVPCRGDLPFSFKKNTRCVCEFILEYIRRAGRFRNRRCVSNDGLELSDQFSCVKSPTCCVRSPSVLCQKPHPSSTRDGLFVLRLA